MIGWYVHHRSSAHMARLLAVRPHVRNEITAFSSTPGPGIVRLPVDVGEPRTAHCAAASPSSTWHYAPVGIAPVRERMAQLAAWVERAAPDVVVVDGSVEVAGLMRLLSVPTVVVRQHGRRDDPVHQRCYDDAVELLAPYPEWMEEDWVSPSQRRRTTYTGGFSRFDGRLPDCEGSRTRLGMPTDEPLVVVLAGRGGRLGWPVDDAAEATPGWHWQVLSREPLATGAHVSQTWVEDPFEWLCAADVVVTHGGHDAVMEVAATGTPMVVIPLDRPFDEQRHTAEQLHRHDLATVEPMWPRAHRWEGVLTDACGRGRQAAQALVDGDGAHRAAAVIDEAADRFGVPGSSSR